MPNITLTLEQLEETLNNSQELFSENTPAEIDDTLTTAEDFFDEVTVEDIDELRDPKLEFRKLFYPYNTDYNPFAETLLTGVESTAADITDGVLIGRQDYTKIELLGVPDDYLYVDAGYLRSQSPSGAPCTNVTGFYYDGQVIQFQYRKLDGAFIIVADGNVVARQSTTGTENSPRWYKFDFGSAKLREIYVFNPNGTRRGDITIEPDTNFYPTRTVSPKISILGDSITAGTGSTGLGYTSLLTIKMGAMGISNYGIGGSGYINQGSTGTAVFSSRISELFDVNPDYIFVAGGVNDVGANDEVAFQAAVDAFYISLLAEMQTNGMDASNLVIFSNFTDGVPAEGSRARLFKDILEAKAEEIGAIFVNAIKDGEEWLSDGSLPALMADITVDTVHPNDAGHLLYAHNIAAQLRGTPQKL